MKLAILADIHGNLPALEAVFADIQQQRVDGIIAAGDLIRGPDDNAVIQLLQSVPAQVIRGNSDDTLLQLASGQMPAAWYSLKQYAALRWCLEHLDESSLAYLKSQPEQRVVALQGADAIRVVHGSPRNPREHLHPEHHPQELEIALDQTGEPVLVCGHTHLAWQHRKNGQLALNPGSAGLPVNGDPSAQYAVLQWDAGGWQVEQRAVDYNLDRIREDFTDSGYLEEGGAFAKALLFSALTGKDVLGRFLIHVRKAALEAGVEDLNAIPDAVWDLADHLFEWGTYV